MGTELAVPETASLATSVREFGAELRPNGLTLLSNEVTPAKIEALFFFLGATHESLRWAIGDALFQGEAIFGDDVYQFQEILNISVETRRQYLRVAGDVPNQYRRIELTWSHHRAVAPMDSWGQVICLDWAVRHGWTKAELEEEIKRALDKPEPVRRPYVMESVCDAGEHIWDAVQQSEEPIPDWLQPPIEELGEALGEMS